MSLHYVIDGYNVINHPLFSRSRKSSQDCRDALLELIRERKLCGSSRNRITLVFDGFPPSEARYLKSDGEEILFSQESSADSLINKLVAGSARPADIMVVSDDKEVRLSARFCGACPLGVEEFILRGQKSERVKSRQAETEPKAELGKIQVMRINQELGRRWGIS